MNKKILVIGSLNMDMIMKVVSLPLPGETIQAENVSYELGGKGANQSCAAARLGGCVKMLGCVGDDDFGRRQKESLNECGVDISELKTSQRFPTGLASIYVSQEGKNSIVVLQGANAECDVEYLEAKDACLVWADCVVLQMEIPWETITYAVNRAHELGKMIIFNPAPVKQSLPNEFLEKLDYITPNETEVMKLCGKKGDSINDYIACAKEILNRGVKNVLVTLGEKGVLLATKRETKIFSTRKVHAIDTTAAGDCFNGALAVALLEGMGDIASIHFANMASSIAVTRNGAQAALPLREEVDNVIGGDTVSGTARLSK